LLADMTGCITNIEPSAAGWGTGVKIFTQMPARFGKVIGMLDGIVLFTGTVSHNMMNVAVKEAKRKRIPVVRSHSSSATSLKELQVVDCAACF